MAWNPVLSYWRKILSQAFRNMLVWGKPQFAVCLIFVFGSAIHFWRFGFSAMVEELNIFLSHTLLPTLAAIIIIFIWQCIKGPYGLSETEKAEKECLIKEIDSLKKQINSNGEGIYTLRDALLEEWKKNRDLSNQGLTGDIRALQEQRGLTGPSLNEKTAQFLESYCTPFAVHEFKEAISQGGEGAEKVIEMLNNLTPYLKAEHKS